MNRPLHVIIRHRFQLGPAQHMTHIDNLASIIQCGGSKSKNRMKGESYHDLSNPDVQTGRAQIIIPETNRPLHDYVPLYFGFKTPMVAVNQDKNEKLIFLRVSLDILATPGVVISDGNARTKGTRFHFYRSVEDLKLLNIKAILSVKYAGDTELKRGKQAEILVPDTLPFEKVLDIICYNDTSKEQILATLSQFGIRKTVMVNPGWYFGSELKVK